MKFHDIDSYDFDALGPIRIERVATVPASFTPATDTGRILYTKDTQYFYYGDADSWVRFSTYDELYEHIIKTSNVHGTSGSVIGEYNPQTLHNKTLNKPTISDFTNANHNHKNVPGGGVLTIDALPHSHETIVKTITKTSHGFILGDVICVSQVDGSYQLALASNGNLCNVFGIVTRIINANSVEVTLQGYVNVLQDTGGIGVKLYLSHQYPGKLSEYPPESLGYLVTPLVISDGFFSGYFHNGGGYRIVNGSYAGLAPKLSGDALTYLNGAGAWVKPSALPVGAIIAWPGTTEPEDFYLCDGRTLTPSSYNALYGVIGTKYGGVSIPTYTYGNGSDGSLTVAAGVIYNITRTMQYFNVTVAAGAILKTNGYTVYVSNTLINYGTITSGLTSQNSSGYAGAAGAADGSPYYVAGGAGGSGGSGGWNVGNITLIAKTIYNYGEIQSNGGAGSKGTNGYPGNEGPAFTTGYGIWMQGSGGGGGGGGGNGGKAGNVTVYYESFPVYGTVTATGGAGGSGGAGGGIADLIYDFYGTPVQAYPYGSGNPRVVAPGNGGSGGNSCWQAFTGNNAGYGGNGGLGSNGANGAVSVIYRHDDSGEPYFRLPDYRGRFLKGSTAGGATVGVVSLEVASAAHFYDVTVMYCIKYR